jgi:NADP-dependent 3-hydroxy acid dehydrogenase YdfG
MEPDEVGRTPLFGIPDDIARAVVFAVAQPIYLNVFELVIRPAKNIDPAAFNV